MTKDISTIKKPIMDNTTKASSKTGNMLKIKVKSKDLLNALSKMRKITDKNSVMEGLSEVKITTKENFITIEATDIEVYLYQKIGATVISPGDAAVNSETFYDVIYSITDEFVEISLDEDNSKLEIIGKNCYFALSALPVTKFPYIEDVKMESKTSISRNDLYKIINYTKFAMSVDETRYNLNGLYLHIKGGRFYSAATDSHRLSVASSKLKLKSETSQGNFGVILPKKTVNKFDNIFDNKILDKDTTLDIVLGVNKIKFSFNNGKMILISKIIDGKFPDYTHFIPKGNQNKLTVNRELFELIIKRVSAVTIDKFKAIKINIGKDMIEITSASSPKGSAKEILKLSSDKDKLCLLERIKESDKEKASENLEQHNNLIIGCNAKYLEEILLALKKEKVIEIYFNDDPRAPLLIKTASNPTDSFVVMPVKV